MENICYRYLTEGICKKKKCKKIHARWQLPQKLPDEVMIKIFDYCDLNSKLRLSLTCKKYFTEFKSFRKQLKYHAKRINGMMNYCIRKVQDFEEGDRIPSADFDYKNAYGQWLNAEWKVVRSVKCPLHQYHNIRVVYTRNARDVDILSFYLDNEKQWYTFL